MVEPVDFTTLDVVRDIPQELAQLQQQNKKLKQALIVVSLVGTVIISILIFHQKEQDEKRKAGR